MCVPVLFDTNLLILHNCMSEKLNLFNYIGIFLKNENLVIYLTF